MGLKAQSFSRLAGEWMFAAFAAGRPVISDVYASPVSGEPRIAVAYPIMREGNAVYILAITWVVGLLLIGAGVGLEAAALGFIVGMVAALAGVLYELRDMGGLRLLWPVGLSTITAVGGATVLQLIAPVAVHGLITLIVVAALAGGLMLLANLWGEYSSVLRMLRSAARGLRKGNREDERAEALITPQAEERQDVPLGTP